MTEKTRQDSLIIWQEQEEGVPEPAILFEPYGDVIAITVEDNVININYESVDEICKALKNLKKNRKP
jgi:hypothetical protein